MACPYAINGLCELSTRLAEVDSPLDAAACRACQLNDMPQTENSVTVSRAIWARRQNGLPMTEELKLALRVVFSAGPGSEFRKLIDSHLAKLRRLPGIKSVLVEPSEKTCGCNFLTSQMNSWGIEGCRLNRELILEKTTDNAVKTIPLVPRAFAHATLSRLLDRAIRIWQKKLDAQ